jgi:hypothetical protein
MSADIVLRENGLEKMQIARAARRPFDDTDFVTAQICDAGDR